MARTSQTRQIKRLFIGFSLCLSSFFVPLTGTAQDLEDAFLPTEVKSFKSNFASYATLSNQGLEIRAEQMRNPTISPSQRAMNYQWLSEHSGSEDAVHGEKAITKLLERQLKHYLENTRGKHWLKNKLQPEANPDSFLHNIDYGLKVRSNKLLIGVTYEF